MTLTTCLLLLWRSILPSALAFTDKWLSTNPEAESDSGRIACEFDEENAQEFDGGQLVRARWLDMYRGVYR